MKLFKTSLTQMINLHNCAHENQTNLHQIMIDINNNNNNQALSH